MHSVAGLLSIADRRAPGPSPTFDRPHILLAFLTIGHSGKIGRQSLASQSGLGEGAIRTILKKLREEGYADASASGCHLTEGGKRVYASLSRKLSPMASLTGTKLTVGESQTALAVRGRASDVRSGIEQRDAAIKAGASGATTYTIQGGRFTIPGGSSNCERDFPTNPWSTLRKELSPSEGDAVVLCGSGDRMSAKVGALAAAISLL
ncbi:MAG: hypothetical protein HY297_00305 [Thaumarchaeota archaeon]|nr:hypothetical protein [Nitrososphaerota archaeon]